MEYLSLHEYFEPRPLKLLLLFLLLVRVLNLERKRNPILLLNTVCLAEREREGERDSKLVCRMLVCC